jgi:hypothetical protein
MMKIRNLKLPDQSAGSSGLGPLPEATDRAAADGARAAVAASSLPQSGETASLSERQTLEIAMLKARIQHLELVVETARSLMGSNQERLLRRLHEVPREIAALGAQLHRIDPHAVW